jgi:hypothetical protein
MISGTGTSTFCIRVDSETSNSNIYHVYKCKIAISTACAIPAKLTVHLLKIRSLKYCTV